MTFYGDYQDFRVVNELEVPESPSIHKEDTIELAIEKQPGFQFISKF